MLKDVFDLYSPGAFGTLLQVIRHGTSLRSHRTNSIQNSAKPSVSSMCLESMFVHMYVSASEAYEQIHTLSLCKTFTILDCFTFLQPLVGQPISSAH